MIEMRQPERANGFPAYLVMLFRGRDFAREITETEGEERNAKLTSVNFLPN